MLQRILTRLAAFEDTLIAGKGSLLESPVCAPAVPHGSEDSSLDTRCDQGGQTFNSSSHAVTVLTRITRDSISDAPPSLHFMPNSLDRVRCVNFFDGLKGVLLEFPLNLTESFIHAMIVHRTDIIENGIDSDIFAIAPSHVLNQGFAEGVLVPTLPLRQAAEMLSLTHARLKRLPAAEDVVTPGSQYHAFSDRFTSEVAPQISNPDLSSTSNTHKRLR